MLLILIALSLISGSYSACTFHNGWTVTRSASNQVLCTNSVRNTLVFQPDGNLVIYTSANTALWSTKTASGQVGTGNMGQHVGFTSGGALEVDNGSGHVGFNTNTAAAGGTLVFQDDTNFVIYNSGGSAVWSSGTQGNSFFDVFWLLKILTFPLLTFVTVTCDCSYNYFWGGCSINRATSDGRCCRCALHSLSCSGTPTAGSCGVGCTSYACCKAGGGSCGGYAESPVGSR